MSKPAWDIGMACESSKSNNSVYDYPRNFQLEAWKIGDHILVFSDRNINSTDMTISATLIDCYDLKSITTILDNENEKEKFILGFHEADENTEASTFYRNHIIRACAVHNVINTFLP